MMVDSTTCCSALCKEGEEGSETCHGELITVCLTFTGVLESHDDPCVVLQILLHS